MARFYRKGGLSNEPQAVGQGVVGVLGTDHAGPTDQALLKHLYGNIMAPPPQAAEPMGNSIRRLLNATQGNQPGWTKLPMQKFTDTEPANTASPGMPGPLGSPTAPWGTATPAASPAGGLDEAWNESLPSSATTQRPQTAREARDALEAFTLQEELRKQRAWAMWRRGLGPNPNNPGRVSRTAG